jgi:hypothetical protein
MRRYQSGALGIFTGLATMIFVIYWLVATSPSGLKLYNYWAIFAVELFVLIFWLCTFALVASKVSTFVDADKFVNAFNGGDSESDSGNGSSSGSGSGNNQYCALGVCVNYKRSLSKRTSTDPVSATVYTDLALSILNL